MGHDDTDNAAAPATSRPAHGSKLSRAINLAMPLLVIMVSIVFVYSLDVIMK